MYDIDKIAIFVKVIEAGSFVRASQALGIPTSTVSRKVAELESSLGVRLLHRTTRKLHPTEPGAAYFRRCSSILDQLQEANLAASESQTVPQGLLRIAAPVLFGSTIVSDWVSEFLTKNALIQAEVILRNHHLDLVQEGIDVAFQLGPLEDSSLIARKLGAVPYMVCASPDYLKVHGVPEHPGQLDEHTCISVTTVLDHTIWGFTNPKLEVEISARLIVNDFVFARRAARNGFGITLLPGYLAMNDIADGRLVTLFEEWQPRALDVYTVYPSKRFVSRKLRTFLDFVDMKIAVGAPWISQATSPDPDPVVP